MVADPLLQQPLARRGSLLEAVRRLFEGRVDVVRRLFERRVDVVRNL